MPTAVEGLLKSPWMKFSFERSGASGCRLLPSSICAPAPLAHQCLPLMPFPMNSTANRRGTAAAVAAQEGTDSSQGRAMVTPAPRSRVRRESCLPLRERILDLSGEELPAGDDGVDQREEAVVGRGQARPHLVHGAVVRGDEGAPQGVAEELATEVIEELGLPVRVQVVAQPLDAGALGAAREAGPRVHRPSAQVARAPLTDGPVALEGQTHGIEAGVAAGA